MFLTADKRIDESVLKTEEATPTFRRRASPPAHLRTGLSASRLCGNANRAGHSRAPNIGPLCTPLVADERRSKRGRLRRRKRVRRREGKSTALNIRLIVVTAGTAQIVLEGCKQSAIDRRIATSQVKLPN
jgi:hypothetical protein